MMARLRNGGLITGKYTGRVSLMTGCAVKFYDCTRRRFIGGRAVRKRF